MKYIKHLSPSLVCAVSFLFSACASAGTDMIRVWVQFEPVGAERAMLALENAGAEIHYRFADLNAFAATVPSVAVQGLSKNPNITLIEEDPKRYPYAQIAPYGIDAIQAPAVWDSINPGAWPLVCLIDSGLHTGHEDVAQENIVGGYPTGWNNDTCGHGTHVAGIITAANNNLGVVGVNPGTVSLYAVKMFDGPDCGWAYSSDLVDAAQRCQTAGAQIINMSLGGSVKSRAEERAFRNLDKAGILSIAAAGNDGNNSKSYPASYSAVMSVAAVDANKNVASFSQQNSAVEIAAPGVGVLSTVPWAATNTLTADGATYSGNRIENATLGTTVGPLADGGLCNATGSWGGQVVLCERGVISFYDKVMNVQNSGGVAAVIYNNESGGFTGTLGDGNNSNIPAIALSQENGQVLITKTGTGATLASTFEKPGSGYEEWSGTSMATPHVAGAAALVWNTTPGATNNDIRAALTQTALDLGEPGRDNAYGYGLVQAQAAYDFLNPGGGGETNLPPTASFTWSCIELSCGFDASGSSDPDDGIASYSWTFGDGSTASGATPSHSYAAAGAYTASLTVTDHAGASNTQVQSVTVTVAGEEDTTAPVISDVKATKTKGTQFVISWTTDEPANSVVTLSCCGSYTNNDLVTSHSMGFRGSRGVPYEYTVSSTDASGNTATAGPYPYQN